MISVLLTSVGTDAAVALCESLRSYFGDDLRLSGVDVKSAVAAQPWLDHFEVAPRRTSSEFLPWIADFVASQQATHIWPLSTADQEIVASRRDDVFRKCLLICSPLDALEIANDKIRLYEFCSQRKMPTPGFEIVADTASLVRAARELGYPARPVVVKIARGAGAEGLKILRAECTNSEMFLSRLNRDVTLERVVAQLENVAPWPRLMVSEYLPGEEFSVDVLRYQGRWHGGVVRRRDESMFGLATDAVVVDRPDLLDLSREIADAIGLEFISNIQYRDDAEGKAKIMEINPRPPGTIGLSIAAGSNLPAIALALSLGRDVSLTRPRIGTRMLRYFSGTVLTP
jgi:carbamoyl-phosphate synthase large subunit